MHLVRSTAFLGVQARKSSLLLTIKASQPIVSKRICKSEQTSKSRWHHEMKLSVAKEIDREFLGWARQAYELSD